MHSMVEEAQCSGATAPSPPPLFERPPPPTGEDMSHYPIVGMTKALSPLAPPSGQRWVTVFTLVKNFTPSMPC
jgi:hypothetical protein